MSTEWIALGSAIFGGFIAMAGKYFTAKFSSATDDEISLRQSTLKRLVALETRQGNLENKVNSWTIRYWSLYRWMVNFCMANDLEIMPPNFHEMENDEIERTVNKTYQEARDEA